MEKKIRRQLERIEDKDVHGLATGDIVTTPLGDKAIIIGIEEWNETKLASVYSDKFAFPQIFPVQELKATGVRKDNIKTILSDLLKENEDGNKDT